MSEKMILFNMEELNDKIINASQKILYYQFPSLLGLHSTLVEEDIGFWTGNYLQILHCCSSHWITASSVGCQPGELMVYDSLFDDIDDGTKWKMEKTFASKVKFFSCKVQKQKDLKDCGLFAVAFAISIPYGQGFEFDQNKMCIHLSECLKK